MGFIALVAVIAVYFYFSNRVTKLEEKILLLEKTATRVTKPAADRALPPIPMNDVMRRPEVMHTAADYSPVPDTTEPSSLEKFFDWCKEDLMVKIGALLLILAFGWFVSYAVAEQWIGPVGQIVIGLLAGVFFLGLGTWRINTHPHQGGIFTVLGSTIVLLVTFAAREVYGLFDSLSALFVMFLSVAFVAFVSVKHSRAKLAYAGLILASIAPLFAGVLSSTSPVDLFIYLLVITLGSLWVVFVTGWTKIILISLVVTYLYSILFIMDFRAVSKDTVLMFSFVFVSIYFVANLVSLMRRRVDIKKHLPVHITTALFTAVFLFTWIEFAMTPEWKSFMYVSWAIIFALGTYFVYSYTANTVAFYLYGAVSVALIGIATAAELNGPELVLAYFLQVCLLIFAAGKLGVQSKTLASLSLLLSVPVLLSLESLNSSSWRKGVPTEEFAILSLAMLVSFLVGLYLHRKNTAEHQSYVSAVSGLLFVGAIGYATALVWLTAQALFTSDIATMIALFIYTLFGITMFVIGTINSQKFVRIIGIVFVSGVVARLLLIEVWDMDLVGRIITFLVVGIMLISTAFISKIQVKNGEANNDVQ